MTTADELLSAFIDLMIEDAPKAALEDMIQKYSDNQEFVSLARAAWKIRGE